MPAALTRRSHGRTRPASSALYQASPARTTSTSGGGSSRASRSETSIAGPVRPCVEGDRGCRERIDVVRLDVDRAGLGRRDRDQPGAGCEVVYPPAVDDLGMLLEVPRERLPAAPRERPVGQGRLRIAGLDLERVPDLQHVVGEMDRDARETGDRPKRGVAQDERAA